MYNWILDIRFFFFSLNIVLQALYSCNHRIVMPSDQSHGFIMLTGFTLNSSLQYNHFLQKKRGTFLILISNYSIIIFCKKKKRGDFLDINLV